MKNCDEATGRNISTVQFSLYSFFFKFSLIKLDSRRRVALFLTIFRTITYAKIHRVRRTVYRMFLSSYTIDYCSYYTIDY